MQNGLDAVTCKHFFSGNLQKALEICQRELENLSNCSGRMNFAILVPRCTIFSVQNFSR